jgi:hypothetical protein
LPETPGIFSWLVDFESFVAVLEGGDSVALGPGQGEEFTDQFSFATVGEAHNCHCPMRHDIAPGFDQRFVFVGES